MGLTDVEVLLSLLGNEHKPTPRIELNQQSAQVAASRDLSSLFIPWWLMWIPLWHLLVM
jgi:hypothetical protein